MKVTSFEISKKLAEIGFYRKFPSKFYHQNLNQTLYYRTPQYRTPQSGYSDKKGILNIPAYDLETILDALPNQLVNENIFFSRLDFFLKISKDEIWYETECFCDSSEYCPVKRRMEIEKLKNESLADTAARLLIKLYEANLVKFNEE